MKAATDTDDFDSPLPGEVVDQVPEGDDDLQDDDLPLDEEDGEEDSVEASDTAADTDQEGDGQGEKPKKVSFTPEQQEVVNGIIGKKTKQQRDAERRALQLENELAELRAKVPQAQRPEIPPMPNVYDDDFEAKVAQRDNAIRAAAAFDAEVLMNQRREAEATAKLQQERQQQFVQTVETYSGRAKDLGINAEELKAAGQAIGQSVPPQLAKYILEDEIGPAITMFLSKNPVILENLQDMDPMRAAVYLETKIKARVVALQGQRKQRRTPPPPRTLGRGSTSSGTRRANGVRFE